MSFSLKYLFALVAIAAIVTAALIYRTPLWAMVAVNLAVVVLLAATIGVLLRRLNRTSWLPFYVVGWFYLAVSFLPVSMKHILFHLPSKHIAYHTRSSGVDVVFDAASIGESYRKGLLLFEVGWTDRLPNASRQVIVAFHRTAEIIDALFALLAGSLAGIISVLLNRQKRERPTDAEH